MNSIGYELWIIALLIVANGLFSMAEIAVVSARKVRLRQRADAGDARAKAALELAESPNDFLSTVQVGITLVGVFAAAFGGATLADKLAVVIARWTALAPYAEELSLALVVSVLTYLTLIMGELVPKRIGLRNPEAIACLVALPMRRLARFASPLVRLLSRSTDALLSVFQLKPVADVAVSEEDVRLLVREGMRAGVFHPSEPAMVERVMGLDHLSVRDLMTPRSKIIWINARDAHEGLWPRIVVSGHSIFPVYEQTKDHVIGFLSVKAVYANLAANVPVQVRDLITPPHIVPTSIKATALLEQFRKTGCHVALVADESGAMVGLVTLHDVLEAIVGEIPSAHVRAAPRAMRREDGSWLVDGMIDAAVFEKQVPGFPLDPATTRTYDTFAGFILQHLGHIPSEGSGFRHHGYRVEIIDMDGPRVDKVLLMPDRS